MLKLQNTDMKKISVIVPVYKTEMYLRQCVESILNQTYTNLELILVDDGSPDGCPRLCDEFAHKDNRIVLIHKKNAGVAAARNSGIERATGDYLTFVDSDDWIEPEMYEKMMDKVNEYNSDVVMCDCIKDFADHSEIYSHDIRSGFYNYEQLRTEYYPHLLMMENIEYPATISNWLILYRIRQSDIQYPTGLVRYVEGVRYSEDLLFGAALMLNARSFYYMKGSCYYHYCMNEVSASHTFVKDKWSDYLKLYRAAQEKIQSPYYDFSEQIDKMLLFFFYNAAGDVMGTDSLSTGEKLQTVRGMLNTAETKKMFKRLRITELPIPWKLKIMTALYRYRGIYFLILLRSLIHGR